jgi:hypothetical protein
MRSRQESTFSTLCKGKIIPKEIEDKEAVTKFLEAVGQFERIMNDSGFITLRRLRADEIVGTETTAVRCFMDRLLCWACCWVYFVMHICCSIRRY